MLPSLSPASGDTAKSADGAATDSAAKTSNATTGTAGTAASPKPSDRTPKSVDFVNLYDVLQMPQESAPADLRKRISLMYLEAQKNQDHRNAQKRMYFQQLYEVYLPQARFLLLEPKRRTEYDQHLTVYREDQAKSVEVEEALNAGEAQTSAVQAAAPVVEPGIEERMTPEELATYRAELWSRWEEGLKQNSGELARLTFSPIELKARAVERQDYMERVMVEVHEENRKAEEKRERLRRQEQLQRELEQEGHRAEEFKRRRDQVFDENVDGLVATARTYWALGVGAACLLFGIALVFVINVYFSLRNDISQDTIRYAGWGISLVAACIGAWKGKDAGVDKVRKRSVKRKDVQKEAEMLARTVVAANKPPESARKKLSAGQERQEAEELNEEINRQARLLHGAAINDIVAETAAYGRAFALGDAIFLIGFGVMYVLDSLLLADGDLALRSPAAILVWMLSMGVAFAVGSSGLKRARQRGLTDTRITA